MNRMYGQSRRFVALACLWLAMSLLPDTALAQASQTVTLSTNAPAKAPAKPKYSLPWGLRPAIAPTVIRSDSSLALSDTGNTCVSTLLAGYKFMPDLGAYGKAAFTYNNPDSAPMAPKAATAISNPLLIGLYTPELMPGLRFPLFIGATLPIGEAGGDDF